MLVDHLHNLGEADNPHLQVWRRSWKRVRELVICKLKQEEKIPFPNFTLHDGGKVAGVYEIQ